MEEYLKFVPLVALAVGVLCGGLGGAFLTLSVTSYKNRRQPIGKRIKFFEIFSKGRELGSLDAFITLTDGVKTEQFDNLFLARITIANRGNKDYSEFKFGITLSNGDKVISIKPETSDRNHIAIILTDVNLTQPNNEVDFKLEPFNRNEVYNFDVLIDVPSENKNHGEILLSTKEPIRFVSLGIDIEDMSLGVELTSGFFPIVSVSKLIKLLNG